MRPNRAIMELLDVRLPSLLDFRTAFCEKREGEATYVRTGTKCAGGGPYAGDGAS